jgi:hypothetical protein
MEFFLWVENSGFATWVRESESIWAYDLYLVCHALGLAAVVGLSVPVALRVLGFARALPLAPMERFFPIMFAGFWVNAASGILLFVAYPTQAMKNPGFFIKMGGVVLAVLTLRRLKLVVFRDRATIDARPQPLNARVLAGALIFFWWGAILAGRLLAYHGIANVERTASFTVTVVSAAMLLIAYTWSRLSGTSVSAQADPVETRPARIG